MLYATIGKPGEGKSLTASIEIRELLDQGITVYSNLHLNEKRENYRYFETDDWQVIFTLQDGFIYFDEGQFILDSRQWEKLPVAFRQLLQKGRHEGLDFVVLTQNIMQIDVTYRRLIHEAKRVFRFFTWKRFNFGIFLTMPIDIQGLDKESLVKAFPEIIFAVKDDWDYYNSYALRSKKEPKKAIQCNCGIIHRLSTEEKLDSLVYNNAVPSKATSESEGTSDIVGGNSIPTNGNLIVKHSNPLGISRPS